MECAEEVCAVCLDPMVPGGDLHTLSCEHTFHAACIAPWLRQHSECPICRIQVVANVANEQREDPLLPYQAVITAVPVHNTLTVASRVMAVCVTLTSIALHAVCADCGTSFILFWLAFCMLFLSYPRIEYAPLFMCFAVVVFVYAWIAIMYSRVCYGDRIYECAQTAIDALQAVCTMHVAFLFSV